MKAARRSTASLAELAVLRGVGPVPPPPAKSGDITVNLAAAVPPALAPEPPPPARASAPSIRTDDILAYWEQLRRGRPFPALADLDRGLVGNSWPGSLIVAFEADGSMPRISRLGGAEEDGIAYTPMVTDWILSRARHAVRRAAKLDEVQSFPMEGLAPRYRMLVLPFAMAGGASDCALCHLCPAPPGP
jgi:hypothetical protein